MGTWNCRKYNPDSSEEETTEELGAIGMTPEGEPCSLSGVSPCYPIGERVVNTTAMVQQQASSPIAPDYPFKYPRECPQDGEPAPKSCNFCSQYAPQLDITVEVEGVGMLSVCYILRTCSKYNWVTMFKTLDAKSIPATSISRHVATLGEYKQTHTITLAQDMSAKCVLRSWAADNSFKLAPMDEVWCADDGENLLALAGPHNQPHGAIMYAALRTGGAVIVYEITLVSNFTSASTTELFRYTGEAAAEVTAIDLAQGPTVGFWIAMKGRVVLKTLYPPREQVFKLDPGVTMHRMETLGLSVSGSIQVLYSSPESDRLVGSMLAGDGKAQIQQEGKLVNPVNSPDIGIGMVTVMAGPSYMEFEDKDSMRLLPDGDRAIFPKEYAPYTPTWVGTSTRRTIIGGSWHG